MKIISVVLSVFVVCFTFAQINQTDAKGKKQGQWVKLYPNSKVAMYQGVFKNDKPIGTFTYRYPSNKVKAVIKHSETTPRSEAFFYYENGKLMTHGIYRNMKKDSVWTSFNEGGRITMTETYKNDVLNGMKKMYYLPSDPEDLQETVISEYNYVDGKPEGKFAEYYPTKPTRTLKLTGQYKNHKRTGEWVGYELSGQKMYVEHYLDGKMHGWFIGYNKEDGKEGQRRYYHFGRLVEGEQLKALMKQMKEKGSNPNGQ